MKKQLTILVLSLVCSTASFAQSTFNNQTFDKMMTEYKRDPVKYLQSESETAPDFVMVGSAGWITDVKGIVAMNSTNSSSTYDYSDLKTRQYGNTGVAVFKMKHSHTSKKGETQTYDEMWTAVYAEKGAKWQLVSWAFAPISK